MYCESFYMHYKYTVDTERMHEIVTSSRDLDLTKVIKLSWVAIC